MYKKNILVTGGAGYIGSHIVTILLKRNFNVCIFDNFVNSSKSIIEKMENITSQRIKVHEGDILNKKNIFNCFETNNFDHVIHLAGLKAVEESHKKPLEYYSNNVLGTLNLLSVMEAFKVKSLIFSSSATIYGDPSELPLKEESAKNVPNSPYGKSKAFVESILESLSQSNKSWNIVSLRYFNPIGSHDSGLLLENPRGLPNNLMPFICKVANKKQDKLQIFGNDYETNDGTGERDYIHVSDLAIGHVKALELLKKNIGYEAINLGTGNAFSVLKIIQTFEKVHNIVIPYEVAKRRKGDVAKLYSDPTKARRMLGWRTEKTLEDMCQDSWKKKSD
tara:strand:+ start:20501 stop:21505 length:1005 start_codon:yes stop_codon:yes gene_type:complete